MARPRPAEAPVITTTSATSGVLPRKPQPDAEPIRPREFGVGTRRVDQHRARPVRTITRLRRRAHGRRPHIARDQLRAVTGPTIDPPPGERSDAEDRASLVGNARGGGG